MEGQNNFVQEPKKKGNGLIVFLLTIIIILLIGVVALLVFKPDYFKLSSDDSTTNSGTTVTTDKEEIEEEVALDSDIRALYDGITSANGHYCGFMKWFTNKKVTPNDLSNKDKGNLVAYRLYEESGDISSWTGKTYSKSQVETAVKKLLGSNTTFTHETLGICPTVDYDSNTETYTVQPGACGGTCGPHDMGVLVKAVKKGNLLILSARVAFVEGDKWYSDYEKTKPFADVTAMAVPDITNNGSLYKVVFKLENGNYGLSYVEPVKD